MAFGRRLFEEGGSVPQPPALPTAGGAVPPPPTAPPGPSAQAPGLPTQQFGGLQQAPPVAPAPPVAGVPNTPSSVGTPPPPGNNNAVAQWAKANIDPSISVPQW